VSAAECLRERTLAADLAGSHGHLRRDNPPQAHHSAVLLLLLLLVSFRAFFFSFLRVSAISSRSRLSDVDDDRVGVGSFRSRSSALMLPIGSDQGWICSGRGWSCHVGLVLKDGALGHPERNLR